MVVIELVGWFIFSIFMMSFIEHQVHCRLMHRPSILSSKFNVFHKMRNSHSVLHHGTYRASFTDEPVPKGEDRGIRLNIGEGLLETLPITLFVAFFSIPGAIIFASVVAGHHFIWNKFHLEMHKPRERFFSDWGAYKCVVRTHLVHHRVPTKNFNVVLPMADYILGTRAKLRHSDLVEMYQLKVLNRQKRSFQSRFRQKLEARSQQHAELIGAALTVNHR